jgi:hypothetical protein
MNASDYTERYTENYCPAINHFLKKEFIIPLPECNDFDKTGEFIVQGVSEDTVSTNIIFTYKNSRHGAKITEVYKNTQNSETGAYIKLLGTLGILVYGYPFLFLDAAVSNISPLTARQEPVTTRIAVHIPQSTEWQRNNTFKILDSGNYGLRASVSRISPDTLPPFWGPLWLVQQEGLHIDMIRSVRDKVWDAYKKIKEKCEPSTYNYPLVREYMTTGHAEAEHGLFKRMGLSVAVEAQAAFFSILSSDAGIR